MTPEELKEHTFKFLENCHKEFHKRGDHTGQRICEHLVRLENNNEIKQPDPNQKEMNL